jgi:hypothetical protein
MPKIQIVAAAVIGMAVLSGTDQAKAQNYPWCAIVEIGVGQAENCGFVSLQQCQATIHSQGGFCQRNPSYRGNDGGGDSQRRRSRRN